jgi:hypothetical protein
MRALLSALHHEKMELLELCLGEHWSYGLLAFLNLISGHSDSSTILKLLFK